jgi:hypothetical protein
MCLLCGTNWILISQNTAFFIVTAVKNWCLGYDRLFPKLHPIGTNFSVSNILLIWSCTCRQVHAILASRKNVLLLPSIYKIPSKCSAPYFHPNRQQSSIRLHGATSHKMILLIYTAEITSWNKESIVTLSYTTVSRQRPWTTTAARHRPENHKEGIVFPTQRTATDEIRFL